MSSAKIMWLLVLVLILSAVAAGLYGAFGKQGGPMNQALVTDFESCVAAGNPVMESYPRQCRSADGRLFVEVVPTQNPSQPQIGSGCAIGGCSSQLCGEAGVVEGIVTDCAYRPEYSCYRTATCERQASGQCGWTETGELKACIANADSSPSDIPTNINVY